MATVKEWSLHTNSNLYLRAYNVYPFNPGCVKILNEILNMFDIEIVVSSDWKDDYTLEQLKDIFNLNNVVKLPIDTTVSLNKNATMLDHYRATEILNYVYKNDIKKYIILDDLQLKPWFSENNFVFCANVFEGIKQTNLKEKIIKKLNLIKDYGNH